MSPPADFFFFLVLRSVVRAAASASQQSFSGNTSSHKFSFSSSSSNDSGFVSSLPCVNPAPAKNDAPELVVDNSTAETFDFFFFFCEEAAVFVLVTFDSSIMT